VPFGRHEEKAKRKKNNCRQLWRAIFEHVVLFWTLDGSRLSRRYLERTVWKLWEEPKRRKGTAITVGGKRKAMKKYR
jgi:hypothetical protein